jgi:pseudouridine-5'-phosphate glycosidase
VPAVVETPLEAALVLKRAWELGLGGVLLANPVSQGLPYEEVARMVEEAGRQAARQGVHGKALTPYLLRKLSELSQGRRTGSTRGSSWRTPGWRPKWPWPGPG